ncbi:MAG TPA: DUF1540 domain-containing protein [Clostridia bacterium]|nr:DUF1540 domain-containing protein [Clostridia bacterium]
MELRVPTGEPISRVKCVVDTCRFNQAGKYCVASGIEIQAPDARNSQETDCATFTPKAGI